MDRGREGWALQGCSGMRRDGLGAQHSIHTGCVNSGSGRILGWTGGHDEQDWGMDMAPGWTGHQDRHTPSVVVASPGPGLSQLSSLNVTLAALCLCLVNSQPRVVHRIHPRAFQREFHHCEEGAQWFCRCVFLGIARSSERWLRMGAALTGITAFQPNMVSFPWELLWDFCCLVM